MSVADIISAVSVVGVVLTAIALLFQIRANREQRAEAADVRAELHEVREILFRQARDVPPEEIVEAIAGTARVSVAAHPAAVGVSAEDELARRIGGDPAAIADLVARLPDREKIVVSLYYYDHLTMREIGEVLGVTESRVNQLHKKAIERLRGATA